MKTLTFLLTGFIVLTALFWASQQDDELSKVSLSLINKVETAAKGEESEAYLYLLGIEASADLDPIELGRWKLAENKKAAAQQDYQIQPHPKSITFSFPRDDLMCHSSKPDCISSLFTHKFDLDELLSQNALLIHRINTFNHYDEFRTLSKPTISEVIPSYHYIGQINRLYTLSAIALYQQHKTDSAIHLLLNNIVVLRAKMSLQDTLIGKLVYVSLISQQLDALSLIISRSESHSPLNKIKPLSLAEKSLDMPFAREFAMSYYNFKELDRNPDFWEPEGQSSPWITRSMFKPNMTINTISPSFLKVMQLVESSPIEFSSYLITPEEYETTPFYSVVRNYVGTILLNIQTPDFSEYVARFFDLDAKIILFNQFHINELKTSQIINPYYPDEHAYMNENKLCFSGIKEKEYALEQRCLLINTLVQAIPQ
ncbi:MAG: hypothetical protein COA90_01350 [Gammaproteobacteria bacterium]|nr:MAG: hypothetical protein COA90_01350 [Gammaproteobacteria bacterium]